MTGLFCRRTPARRQEDMPMAKRKKIRANRQYKDTVFRMLFSDKKNLLSLYNAINRTSYTDLEQLEIVTLENAVYMGMKNDLAFIINTNLFLYEHQSTYNPNNPLRDLFYIASEYQKIVDKKSLYSSVLQKIPAPRFLVFYNGTKNQDEIHEEYLSEAFENLTGDADLELKVTVLNINEGHNRELMEQCRVLREYAQYVARVRKYVPILGLDGAVARAVSECIKEGILSEFLRRNRAEVEKVSIFEYDKEEEDRKLREAEYEGGWEAGEKAGMEAGKKAGMKAGIEQSASAMIRLAREFHMTDDAIAKLLQDELHLDEETVRRLLK